jgi:hypothetical protein
VTFSSVASSTKIFTQGTPVMLPERGPMAGRGVTERMASVDQRIVTATEVVTARPV